MNIEMLRGDTFDTRDYDIVASAQVTHGGGPWQEVIVLNNNSTHYIVATRQEPRDILAKFECSFRYDDRITPETAYKLALDLMTTIAKMY